jgi:hypothetical protein
MADAYSINVTTKVLSKNASPVANLLDWEVTLKSSVESTVSAPSGYFAFDLTARIHDTASDARILAQGPLGGSVSRTGFIGVPSVLTIRSKKGDTLVFTNLATITDGDTTDTVAFGSGTVNEPLNPADAFHKVGV